MGNVTSTISTLSTYVTKYFAGGSGDNIIPDGYIKTVEKVWIDNYTIGFTNTLTAIAIADLPENKKVTSINVEIYTSVSQTGGTVSIGYLQDTTDILATGGVADFLAPTSLTHNLTRTSIALPGLGVYNQPTATSSTLSCGVLGGFQAVTAGTNCTIAIKLNNWTMTTGTIKTIVRYT